MKVLLYAIFNVVGLLAILLLCAFPNSRLLAAAWPGGEQ